MVAFGTLGVLALLVVVLFVTASTKDAQDALLKRDGVAVAVTVTRCSPDRPGVGGTVGGATCRGAFELHGVRQEAVISGLRGQRNAGTVVAGVTDPGDPNLLAWRPAVLDAPSRSTSYLAPALVLVVVLVTGALLARRVRRREGPKGTEELRTAGGARSPRAGGAGP